MLLACAAASSAADLPDAGADGWHTWRVEVVDAAPELCCFLWNSGIAANKHCNLDGRHGGFSSSQYPVTSDSAITDLGAVAVDDSVDWLQRQFAPQSGVAAESIEGV